MTSTPHLRALQCLSLTSDQKFVRGFHSDLLPPPLLPRTQGSKLPRLVCPCPPCHSSLGKESGSLTGKVDIFYYDTL